MGDYISREALLRAVSEAADVELVRRWIPVNKRLPKDCGGVSGSGKFRKIPRR